MRVIDVVNGLTERMRQQGQLYAEATVVVQGMDEKGDFVELQLRGDFKVGRDMQGRPTVILK